MVLGKRDCVYGVLGVLFFLCAASCSYAVDIPAAIQDEVKARTGEGRELQLPIIDAAPAM